MVADKFKFDDKNKWSSEVNMGVRELSNKLSFDLVDFSTFQESIMEGQGLFF